MSIRVPIDELVPQLGTWGTAAVITSSADGARVVALIPAITGGDDSTVVLRFATPGRSTLNNVAAQPAVTLYFAPHGESDGYSLIVDGDATVDGEDLIVRPSSAVLHRPPPIESSASRG